MPRPSIVIGVGGTGVSVLSWVKKNLLEAHGAAIDDIPVRLLLVDVVEPDVMPGRAGVDSNSSELAGQYGADVFKTQYLDKEHDIDLAREFVQLAGDIKPSDIEQIKRGIEERDDRFEHFARWYCNGFFPSGTEQSLRDGAGRLRQLGRLSLTQGLHMRGENDQLYARLKKLLDDIGRNADNIDIHMVGSFAGGTGAGIFMDIAWLVRKLVEETQKSAFITGFFAMPEALAEIASDNMTAKAFNAWRELNRMLAVNRQDGSDFEVSWGAGRARNYRVEKPIFDHIYLAASPVEGRYRSPKNGLFPMMGEAIGFFIDSESGQRYIQRIRTNLGELRTTARYRGKPTYSTFFVRSWKIPAFNSRQHRRHDIAEKFLQRVLQVRVTETTTEALRKESDAAETDNEQQLSGVRRGQIRVGDLARVVQLKDTRCGDRVADILTSDMSLAEVGNTLFLVKQDDWRRVEASQKQRTVEQMAYDDLYRLYISLPETEEGSRLLYEINTVMDFALPDPPDVRNKKQLQDFAMGMHDQIYGNRASRGEYHRLYGDFIGERQKGQVYEVLSGVHDFHIRLFRQRLTNWMSNTMNARQDDSGLACVINALERLRFDLRSNLNLLEEVSNGIRPVDVVREECDSIYQSVLSGGSGGLSIRDGIFGVVGLMLATGVALSQGFALPAVLAAYGAFILIFGVYLYMMVGRGGSSVDTWWEAENEHLAVMSNRRTVQRMVETQRTILKFVEEEALPNARALEAKLVTGSRTQDLGSVYQQVYTSLELERIRASADRMAEGVVNVLDVPNEYDQGEEQALEDILNHTSWKVSSNMNMVLSIDLPEQAPVIIDSKRGEEGRQELARFTNNLITRVAETAIQSIDRNALDYIPDLQAQLQDVSKRWLYKPSPRAPQPGEAVRTFYLQCDYTDSDELARVEGMLKKLDIPDTGNSTVSVTPTENRNKVTAFHALEMLHPEDFAEWETCKTKYWDKVLGDSYGTQPDPKSVRCDHLFAAEKNALELEYALATKREYRELRGKIERPIFSSRLVHLMEHRSRFINFLRLWTLGYVQEQRGTKPAWLLIPPMSTDESLVLNERNSQTDVLQTITRFVYHNEDMERISYSHRDIATGLDKAYERDWYMTPELSRSLQDRFEYERTVSVVVSKHLQPDVEIKNYQEIEKKIKADIAVLQEQFGVASLYFGDEPHLTLAEAIADDVVTQQTADESQLQMVSFVLPLLYDELIEEVADLRKRNRWN